MNFIDYFLKEISKFSYAVFLCPHLPKAGVGHIAFRRDVTSVRAYVRMCVCHVRNQIQVYLQV